MQNIFIDSLVQKMEERNLLQEKSSPRYKAGAVKNGHGPGYKAKVVLLSPFSGSSYTTTKFVSGEVFAKEKDAVTFAKKWIELKNKRANENEKTKTLRALANKLNATNSSSGY